MKLFLASLAVLALTLASCSGGTTASTPSAATTSKAGAVPLAKERLRIAVVPKGTSHEFWKAVEKGARNAAAELGDVDLVWKGPTGEGDAAAQVQLVEGLLADGLDGLCIAPLDARALSPTVASSIERGTPVVVFDSGLDRELPIVSFVATDNENGGRIAGEELARRLAKKSEARVLVLRYLIGSQSTLEREKGALEALARHPNVRVVRSDVYCGPDEAAAIAESERLLATHDEIDGVFCSNESTTSGFLTALQRDPRGLAKQVAVVGFDSSARLVDALSNGVLHATVLQDPVSMGYFAVKAMHAHARGGRVAARIATGETLATLENGSGADVQRLLKPLASEHAQAVRKPLPEAPSAEPK